MAAGGNERRGLGEAVVVLSAYALVAAAVLVTYARLPTDELYSVSVSGIPGGLGRALVFLNYSTALVAVPIALIAGERIGTRAGWVAAAIAVALSGVIFVPGIVEQSDLDARWRNALPAAGVLLTAALTVVAVRRAGAGLAPRRAWDPLRIGIGVVLLAGSVPWILAEVGLSLDGVPALGSIWLTGELRLQPGHAVPETAVHAGHHHGFDGALLAGSALLLSRLAVERLVWAVRALLALMFSYGMANAIQDWWLEQVVKRGLTDAEIPSMILPRPTAGWAAIVVATLLLLACWAYVSRPRPAPASP